MQRASIHRIVKDPVICDRGLGVFEDGRVQTVTRHAGYLEATVRGSAEAPYYVHVQLQENGDPRLAICTCPYFARAGECKHVAAVLFRQYAAEHPGEKLALAVPPSPAEPPPPPVPTPRARPPEARAAAPHAPESAVVDLTRLEKVPFPTASAIDALRAAGLRPQPAPAGRPRYRPAFAIRRAEGYDRPLWTLAAAARYVRKDGVPGRLSGYRASLVDTPAEPAQRALLNRLARREGHQDLLANQLQFLLAHRPAEVLLDTAAQVLPVRFEPLQGVRLRFQVVDADREQVWFAPVLLVEGAEPAAVDPADAVLDGLTVALVLPDGRLVHREGDERLYRLLEYLSDRADLFASVEIRQLREVLEGNDSGITVEFDTRRIRFVREIPQPILELDERGEELHLRLFFGYGDREVPAEAADLYLSGEVLGEESTVLVRNLPAERRVENSLLARLRPDTGLYYGFRLSTFPSLSDFLQRHGRTLLEKGVTLRLKARKRRIGASGGRIAFSVQSGIDWFDLQAVYIGPDGARSEVEIDPDLLAAGLLKMGDAVTLLSAADVERLLELQAEGMDGRGALRVSKLHVGLIDRLYEEILNRQDPELRTARQIAVRLQGFQGVAPAEPPAGFRGRLRDYQGAGLSWLLFLQEHGLGGCLADDMGLGKTVQALAFLQTLKERGRLAPSLILVPVTTLANWESEIRRFAPGLDLAVHHGQRRGADGEALAGRDLTVTSYHTLRRDIELFRQVRWRCVILDESQAIKNAHSQLFKAVRLLQAEHRLSLTGTPVENNTFELWSQMEFLNPGLLGSMAEFRRRYSAPIEGGGDPRAAERLRRLVYPFILRRRKEEVARELPPKTEVTLYSEMDRRQRGLYSELRELYRRRVTEKIDRDGIEKSSFEILTALLRLRQAALFPGLVDARHDGIPSCKFEQLQETVEEVLEEGHKVLIFSQFVEALSRIRAHFEAQRVGFSWLDGSTPASARKKAIERFNGDPEVKLFLLSLKAGGTGINLTAADYVILYDPWWNPAVESQAIDRTHRIGQTRKVIAYRMIVRDTIEEKIQELQARKKGLAEELLAAEAGIFKSLTREDILALM